jgi:hypothetical protein
MIVDRARQRRTDALGILQIGEARAHDALQAAEMRQQRSPPRRSQSGHRLEHRLATTARASTAMARDGKSVRLIAHPLDEVQRCTVGLQHEGLGAAVQKQPLLPGPPVGALGDADDRQVGAPGLCERIAALST